MKKEILLVLPSVDTCYEHISALGLMNLYLVGKAAGHSVHLLDLSRESYAAGLKKILCRGYDIVGISCNFTNAAPFYMRYAKAIREKYPDTLIIAGGNHATLAPQDILGSGYDYILYGEAEESFREFLFRLEEGIRLDTLQGLCYLREGKIIRNEPYPLIEELDSLPFNDFSEFDLEPFFKRSKMRYLNIETSRGCVYDCAFCATVKMWGHNVRYKSAQRVLEEFRVAQRLKADFIFICDDDTAIDESRLRGFCELLIKSNVNVPWGTTIGSSSIKKEETFDLLAESGCVKINVCIESANPRILKAYRKPYTIADNRRTIRALSAKGILVHNHGIIGSPQETLTETLRTYSYLISTSPIWHVSILEPRPGTDYWKGWPGQGDTRQYRLFGKANPILSGHKLRDYLLYRFFALCYFLNPARIKNALFHPVKAVRYSYRVQYRVAWHTIKENLAGFWAGRKDCNGSV